MVFYLKDILLEFYSLAIDLFSEYLWEKFIHMLSASDLFQQIV
jgi:hypothetical protein